MGRQSTYAVTLESQATPAPGTWEEHYEFDINLHGIPTRFRTVIESGTGLRCERESLVRATQELNGTELVTEAISYSTNSAVENYGIDRFVVCSAEIDAMLSSDDVLFEPDRRNAVVWTQTSAGQPGRYLAL